ncbi:D-alanyl-D-alanine carboxypeptidase [Atopobacter sp. AH10]|uniref:D-alanyl-D-alanine carboxypeptidase family protein n=1 Tax=Atopobacter sp. AH10 TaxID=2315861 RepID=UPI000EF1EC2C|nr:D-alanyl-D-alanine carboxypeptidase family protein [Atopobacter sp. AH10]RLK62652.1 D-alanyl-D-alanine carboxypeptidase [Atopobacter sp. AH10]
MSEVNRPKLMNWILGVFTLVTFALLGISPVPNAGQPVVMKPTIEAKAAVVANEASGKVLFDQNGSEQLPIASMTKVITAYIIYQKIANGEIHWKDQVPVSQYAHDISGNYELSNVPLSMVEHYTVQQLMETLFIYSSNASAIALAEYASGSEKAFVKEMSSFLESLGIENYQLFNASGLTNNLLGKYMKKDFKADAENELSARDMALVCKKIIDDYPEVLKIARMDNVSFVADSITTVEMKNFNHMLPGRSSYYKGVDGLKTGTTEGAGPSFAGTVKRGGVRLVSVVIGAKEPEARFSETARLYDYIFDKFDLVPILAKGSPVKGKSLEVVKGKEKQLPIAYGKTVNLHVTKGTNHVKDLESKVSIDYTLPNEDGKLLAPIKKGQKVGLAYVSQTDSDGYLQYDRKGEAVPIVASKEVKEANFIVRAFHDLWRKIKLAF